MPHLLPVTLLLTTLGLAARVGKEGVVSVMPEEEIILEQSYRSLIF